MPGITPVDKKEFLARLPHGAVTAPDRPPGPAETPPSDILAELSAKLKGAGMGVHLLETPAEALAHALDLIRQNGAELVGAADLGPELNGRLPQAARQAGLELVTAGDGQADLGQLEPLQAGLTRADLALASVGGLAQAARPGGGRLMSLLPPLHVVLLSAGDVLPSLDDLPAALNDPARFPGGPPPAVSIIGGPSKTGDIEAVIVLGVHGPGRVEVVIWSQPGV